MAVPAQKVGTGQRIGSKVVIELGDLPPAFRTNKPAASRTNFKGRPAPVLPRQPVRLVNQRDIEIAAGHREPERPGLADRRHQDFLSERPLDGVDPNGLTLLDQSSLALVWL